MRTICALIIVCTMSIGTGVQAFAPMISIRPKPRVQVNGGVQGGYVLATSAPVYRSGRPLARPRHAPTAAAPPKVAAITPRGGFVSRAGSVCGDPLIKGTMLAPIQGKLPGCRIDNPVRITSIDGVTFSQQPILDCTTARTLRGWIDKSLLPMFRYRDGGVRMLSVPSHYSCRTRNSQPGAKLSEHAKGRAIDISAITLADGKKITIRDGWKNRRQKRLLVRLHNAACGPFGTVLGPDANKYHRDHFHFDTARYRGGAYCR